MSVSGSSRLIMVLILSAVGIIILLAILHKLGLFFIVNFYDLLVNPNEFLTLIGHTGHSRVILPFRLNTTYKDPNRPS